MTDKEITLSGRKDFHEYQKGDYLHVFETGHEQVFLVVKSTRKTLTVRPLRWYERLGRWLEDLRWKFCDLILGD